MNILHSSSLLGTTTVFLALSSGVHAQYLAPENDLNFPASDSASNPMEWLGANGAWFAGPNVNGIDNSVPEGCVVDQVAYNVRHGSRYPDTGAYAQWTALYAKIQNSTFTTTDPTLQFLHTWKPVLTNPTLQIAQESPTGYKEAYDLGYTLRTRYPNLYTYGQPFISWANLYPRVVQTAQNFVRGFLGNTASSLGMIVTVNSTGSEEALFDSLSPSDLCPNFVDGNGGAEGIYRHTYSPLPSFQLLKSTSDTNARYLTLQPSLATTWNSIYLPPITSRINNALTGNLTFTTTDISIFPYLCGFESQITGSLSPFCSTFSNTELQSYEYAQDLRYYYGTGPGTLLPSKMMLPYLTSLITLLATGPGQTGTFQNGTSFPLPNILTAFMNDGQITELGAASGIWDSEPALSGQGWKEGYKYLASRFVNMRGTIAFERLNCTSSSSSSSSSSNSTIQKRHITETQTKTKTKTICPTTTPLPTTQYTTSTILQTKDITITKCQPHERECTIGLVTKTIETSTTICPVTASGTGVWSGTVKSSGFTTITSTPSTSPSSPSYSNTTTNTSTTTTNTSTTTTTTTTPTPTPPPTHKIYIRILLNSAPYPLPFCSTGPGSSCPLSTYSTYLTNKLSSLDLEKSCNVTTTTSTTTSTTTTTTTTPNTFKGASFFKDLSSSWLASVAP